MTAIETGIKTFLAADATLMAILDGGIVTFDETGRNGIGPQSTPSLYDADLVLQTVLVVREVTEAPRGGIRDSKVKSTSAPVQLWFMDDGDTGYGDINTARERVFTLLDDELIVNLGFTKWVANLDNIRDSSLQNAAGLRSDYVLIRVRR